MLVIKNDTKVIKSGGVFALGNFDGVHLGHKEIIDITKNISTKNSSYAGVIVFEPHPRKFFNKDSEDFYLSDLKTKEHLLEMLGMECFVVLDFNKEMSERTPVEFIKEIIIEKIKPSSIVVGYDFRFGKNRAGGVEDLERICSEHNISVKVVEKQKKDESVLSSSNVRSLLQEGDFNEAEKMLGHKWLIKGQVIAGDKRGREIGFPTANLEVNDFLKIKFGVYAVNVDIDGDLYNGIANYGIRPTFKGKKLLLETYIFDFSKDIYGKDIVVSFIEFIREEKKFEGVDLLKKQIDMDSKKALEILGI